MQAQPATELQAQLPTLQGRARLAALVELTVAYRQEAPEQALLFGEQALAMLEDLADPAAEVSVLNEMAWAQMVLGRHGQARKLAERGLDLARQQHVRDGEARALNNLGVIARSHGSPVLAIGLFEQALALYRELAMDREVASSLNNLGVAHGFDLADYGTALDYQLQALALRRQFNDPQELALSYNNIGVIYSRLGEHDRALEHFQHALQIRRQLGVNSRIAGTLHNLGDLFIDRKDWPQALTYHQEAYQLREQSGDLAGLLTSLIALGSIHAELGDSEQAESLLARALDLGESRGARKELMLTQLALAQLARKRGDLGEAAARAEQAVQLADQVAALDSARQAYLELATVRELAGDFSAALQAHKRYKQTSDQIFAADKTRRIELLESRYQTERQQHEIETLRRQQAEQDLQLGRRRFQRDVLAGVLAVAIAFVYVLHRRRKDLEQVNRKLAELSFNDSLTGLRNRRFLQQLLGDQAAPAHFGPADAAPPTATAESQRAGGNDLVFLLIDIDYFKQVNDDHGHAAGDRILQQFADILRSTCRRSDALVRWGGEEFLVVDRFVERSGAGHLAERLRLAVAAHAFDIGAREPIRMTCSIGFAAYPLVAAQPDAYSWEQVVAIADEALYAAKRCGRDAWVGVLAIDSTLAATVSGENTARSVAALADAGALTLASSLADPGAIRWSDAPATG